MAGQKSLVRHLDTCVSIAANVLVNETFDAATVAR